LVGWDCDCRYFCAIILKLWRMVITKSLSNKLWGNSKSTD
jgi:hypothetical protein